MIKRKELRIATDELTTENRTVRGLAVVYESPTNMGDFIEVVRRGAVRVSGLKDRAVQALYHHNDMQLLGSTKSGTLRLQDTKKGLAFALDIPKTSYGDDVLELIKRGDVSGCSFGFVVQRENWIEGEKLTRELLDVVLHEITLTHNPAYADTTVALRSKPVLWSQHPAMANAKRWLETC